MDGNIRLQSHQKKRRFFYKPVFLILGVITGVLFCLLLVSKTSAQSDEDSLQAVRDFSESQIFNTLPQVPASGIEPVELSAFTESINEPEITAEPEITTEPEVTAKPEITDDIGSTEEENESLGVFKITVYTPSSDGGIWGYKTSTGVKSRHLETCAVDPKVIPLGTSITLGELNLTAVDTGSSVKGNIVDVFYDGTYEEALKWIKSFGTKHEVKMAE